jgi:CRISPR-associated protein Cmr6
MLDHFRNTLPTHTQGTNAMHRLRFGYGATDANSQNSTIHFSTVCNTAQPSAGLYRKAYTRWENLWNDAQKQNIASMRKYKFMHRVLIDLSQPSLWESHTSFNSTYGTPVLSGSACKGLARHFAQTHLDIAKEHIDALFENTSADKKVQFMDAWWVPDSAPGKKDHPWVREIVTPHHPEFMSTKGAKPATPFDSPKPSPQLGTHGQFLFVVSGPKLWADYAQNILQIALENEGIGARAPEYGCIA